MNSEITKAAELLQTGSDADFEQALERLQRTIFAFSMKVCGHREDAEDTMQEVLLQSLAHLRKIDNPQALAVWLYKTAQTRCWMKKRKSKFAPQETLGLDSLMPDGRELSSLLSSPEPTPESAALTSQQTERLHEAVLRIPPLYRIVLVLHDMEELEIGEVAKILDLAEGTVRVRLHRARLFVRRELATPSALPSQESSILKGKRRVSPGCRVIFANLSEYMDHRIDDGACAKIQKHLAGCPACIAFLEDLKRAVERCHSYQESCDSKVLAAIHHQLLQEFHRLQRLSS